MSAERIEDRNRRVVRRHYDAAWNARDLSSIAETHAADFVHHDPSNPAPLRGPAGVQAQLAAVHGAFPDLRMTVDDIVAEGDAVVVRFHVEGTHGGPFAGIPATGRSVRIGGMVLHRFRDGLIVEDHVVRDTFGLMVQLGVVPAPGKSK